MNISDDIKNDFSKGSVRKHIVRLAVPMTVAMLVQMLYNLVDRIYIGHLPEDSANAFTGLGLTFPIVTLVLAFTNLFGTGGAPSAPSTAAVTRRRTPKRSWATPSRRCLAAPSS